MWYNGLFCIPITDDLTKKLSYNKKAKILNSIMFQQTFSRLFIDAMNRYHFEGLPETVNERVLLQALMVHGNVIFFEKGGSVLALPGGPTGDGISVYGDFGGAWVYSLNGILNEEVKLYIPGSDKDAFLAKTNGSKLGGSPKGVLVRENEIMYPFVNYVWYYAQAISDAYRTLDVAKLHLKFPYIITAEESVVPSVKKWMEQIEDNTSLIVNSGVFPADKVKVDQLNTTGESVHAITELLEWYENKFRELCGIDSNAVSDKRGENLLMDEIHINDQATDENVDKTIKTIQKGLDDVNMLFGLNITVERNQDESEVENNDDIFGNDNKNTDPV